MEPQLLQVKLNSGTESQPCVEFTEPGQDVTEGGLEHGGRWADEDVPAVGEHLQSDQAGEDGRKLSQEVIIK